MRSRVMCNRSCIVMCSNCIRGRMRSSSGARLRLIISSRSRSMCSRRRRRSGGWCLVVAIVQ